VEGRARHREDPGRCRSDPFLLVIACCVVKAAASRYKNVTFNGDSSRDISPATGDAGVLQLEALAQGRTAGARERAFDPSRRSSCCSPSTT